jgi:hypothetical protein
MDRLAADSRALERGRADGGGENERARETHT